MLSVAKVGVAHVAYYTSSAAAGVPLASPARPHNPSAYYTDGGQQPGVWASPGAMGVAAGAAVTPEQLKAVLAGMDPLRPSRQLGRKVAPGDTFVDQVGIVRQRKPVGAFDCTYSLPKTVSAAWALADEPVRQQIEAAWSLSVDAVIAYLQANAVASRSGAGGIVAEEVPDGATIARFDHYTSRAGDPQLHSHLLVANKVLCEDGTWRTLDGRLIYAAAKTASLVGAAVLRAEISNRLGWSWDRIDDRLHADLAGSPDELIEAWSSRRRDVAKEATRRIHQFEADTGKEPTPTQRLRLWDQAAVASRKSKKLLPLDGDPYHRWRSEAAELGLDAAAIVAGYRTAARVEPGAYDRPELVIDDAQLVLAEKTLDRLVAAAEDQSTSLSDVELDAIVYAAINAGPGCGDIGRNGDELVAVTAAALRRQLEARLVHHRGRWWSPGLIAAEQATAGWLASEGSADELAAERLDVEGLGEDQAAAVEALVRSTTKGAVLIGPAGAGKTTTLARFAAAVGHDRVIAAAPTAVAAGTLGTALGTSSSTVALINVSDAPIPEGGWVIVDEAGQLATRDLAALCGRAAAADARVLMVGDPAQQGSVSAGGMFDALAASDVLPAAALTQLWRFEDPAEAAATSTIHRGHRSGLDYHAERGRITSGAHGDVADEAANWWDSHRGVRTVISVPTLELMYAINAEIAARRVAAGETGQIVHGRDDRAMRIGDVVTTRKNDRRQRADDGAPIRNGDRWVVEATTADGDLVLSHLDRQATVTLPAGYAAAHLDLGYCVTQTRAQSITVDAAMTIITGSSSRDQLYVGLTRGSAENHLHIITDTPGMDPETAPKHTTAEKIIKAVFDRRHGWATASDITNPALDRDEAAAHLALVAAAAPGQHLPANDHLKPTDMIDQRNLAAQRVRADEIDDTIADGIDDWLAGLHEHDAHTAHIDDQERAQMEHSILEAIDTHHHPGSSGHSSGDRALPNTPQAPAPVPEDSGDAEGRWRPTLGAVRKARGLLNRDFVSIDTEATAQIRQNNRKAAIAGQIDNPWLVQLWDDYQRADQTGKTALTPVLAAIADPPVRQRIQAITGCPNVPPAISDWVDQVRAAVIARRLQRHRDVLDHLASTRATAVAQAAGDDHPTLIDADQLRWDSAVSDWVDRGCDPRQLDTAWEHTALDTANQLLNPDTTPATPQPADATAASSAAEPPLSPPAINVLASRAATHQPISTQVGQQPGTAIIANAAAWYHEQLLHSPHAADARAYLRSRGITEDQWDTWQLGWAPNQWQGLAQHLQNSGTDLDDAVETGVIGHTRGRYWDFLRGRVVFPITNAAGEPIALAGRTLDSDGPKYLNTRNSSIYQKSSALFGLNHAATAIAETGEAVIVEGYTDAIAAHTAGIHNAVAACGTAFCEEHVDTLRDHAGNPGLLTIAYDADPAGAQAAQTAGAIAAARGMAHRTAQLPDGTDPADLEPDELRQALADTTAPPWSDLPSLAGITSVISQYRAGTKAAKKAGAHSAIAAIIASHEIALITQHDLQQLIDHAAAPHLTPTGPRHNPPSRARPSPTVIEASL